MNNRQLIITKDGSHSLYLPDLDETYHSTHGAIQEAYHVFIKNGLEHLDLESISILEIGLGTGLNCFISFLESEKKAIKINYTGIEAYPITKKEKKQLNYVSQLNAEEFENIFNLIHSSEWATNTRLSPTFNLEKKKIKFQDIVDVNKYNLIFFDAFGPRVQPDLWDERLFKKMYDALLPNGVLVTYSAKGSVRRAMQSVGFLMEKLPGPPGKREMLRAVK